MVIPSSRVASDALKRLKSLPFAGKQFMIYYYAATTTDRITDRLRPSVCPPARLHCSPVRDYFKCRRFNER